MLEYRKTVKRMLGIRPRQVGNEMEHKEPSRIEQPNPALNTTRSETASSVWCTRTG